MIAIREYQDLAGKNSYRIWFDGLDIPAAVKVASALERLAHGNTSCLKPLGGGVSEYRIDWGPGYRIYLGQDGNTLVILLGGGTKRRQDTDIKRAKISWIEYGQRKAPVKKAAAKSARKETPQAKTLKRRR